MRGVCGKVIRRLLSLRLAAAFEAWQEFIENSRRWVSRCFAEQVSRQHDLSTQQVVLSHWFRYVMDIKRLRSIGQIIISRNFHVLLLRVIWSWRWSISYRQLGLEKMASRRMKSQITRAFKTMRAAVAPNRSWLMDRFQNHILLSAVFDSWAASSAFSVSVCALIHRHYTFPVIVAWRRVALNNISYRKMFKRRIMQRWRALMRRRNWIRIAASALRRHSSHRCFRSAFNAWRGYILHTRFDEKFHLRFAFSSWSNRARVLAWVKLFRDQLLSRKNLRVFKAWRRVADAARLAPILKLHTYASAASRRAVFSAPSSPQSPQSQPVVAAPAETSRASHIPWRS